MKVIKYSEKNFNTYLESITRRRFVVDDGVEKTVHNIVQNVKIHGDEALFDYTKQFDNFSITSKNLKVKKSDIQKAYTKVNKEQIKALKDASKRIRLFHKKQVQKPFSFKDEYGSTLGQLVTPLDKVCIYVPGGKASYPSSVLMNAIPAKIAGVNEIIMCSPASNGELNPHVLVAADMAGVDTIYKVGGAQAVAAAAYGTRLIRKADKIVGPGNIYVTLAKKIVFGEVDIDMIAGPSEICVIADQTAKPQFVAGDLLSQAEHDEMAVMVLITDSIKIAGSVIKELDKQKNMLNRLEIAKKSLKDNLSVIITKDLKQAADISNMIAPEHLELAVGAPFKLLRSIKNAGSIFLGHYTPESVGDYIAGPNHVLPTGGTARFFSPLGVYDFQKRSSIISFTKAGCMKLGKAVSTLAILEGLDGHAKAISIRE